MVIVSIFDSKVEAFLAPIAVPNVAVAIRQFQHAINSAGTDFNLFPADYTLFHVGEWDEKNGVPTALSAPKSIVLGSLLVKKELE